VPHHSQTLEFFVETFKFAHGLGVVLYPPRLPEATEGGGDTFRAWPLLVRADGDDRVKEFIIQNKPRFLAKAGGAVT